MAESTVLTENQKTALKHFGKNVDDPATPPVKTQAELDAEKLIEDQRIEAEKLAAEKKQKEEEAKNTTPAAPAELTDEQLLEMASKRAGRKITSWDDLKLTPTQEEKIKSEEERESEKLSFGLKKGLFNKKQFEAYISDRKSPVDLVYSRELAEAKKEDSAWDEEKEKEFKEEFDEKFGLNLDESSSKNKRGKKQLSVIADSILRNEYSGIYSLEGEFSKHESAETTRKQQEQKVLEIAPIYKQDVESVVSSFKTIDVDFAGEKFQVPVPVEALQMMGEAFLDTAFAGNKISSGYKKAELDQTGRSYLLANYFNQLSFEAAKLYRAKHEKGVRGIPTGGKMEETTPDDEGLTENQKKALAIWRNGEKTIAN